MIHELVAAQARRTPAAPAVWAHDARLSYEELDRRSNQVAHLLRARGLTAGSRVGLCLERSAALVVGALGILKAGCAYVALDPEVPAARLEFMLRNSGAATQLAGADAAPTTDGPAIPVIILSAGWAALSGQPTEPIGPLPPTAESNLAYIIYTSGSSGTPKGVMLEHDGLSNLVQWHQRAFEMGERDRCSQMASPGFDASVWELWPALASGASVLVPSDDVRGRPEELRNWLVRERITVSFVPTPLAELLLALEWPTDTALRFMLTGGDLLHRHPEPGLPFTIVNNYGPSECTVVATSGVVPPCTDARFPPSLGRAIDGVTVAIVDEDLSPVQAGDEGELLIGGVGVGRGYVNQPALTAERFIMVGADEQHGTLRMYRTGDLVRAGLNGDLHFLGRIDDQVKIRGRRIELGEIAATLDGHPGVSSSVAVVGENGTGDKRLVAYVVASAESGVDGEALRGHLAERLPGYMVPQAIVFLDELPMTPNGKVDRAALPASGRIALDVSSDSARPVTELEEYLAGTVAELLGNDMVALDDNFFLLGGHSLLGAQLIARIADRYGIELPLRTLFDEPTVSGMAAEVERLLVADVAAMSEESVAELLAAGDASSRADPGIGTGNYQLRS